MPFDDLCIFRPLLFLTAWWKVALWKENRTPNEAHLQCLYRVFWQLSNEYSLSASNRRTLRRWLHMNIWLTLSSSIEAFPNLLSVAYRGQL